MILAQSIESFKLCWLMQGISNKQNHCFICEEVAGHLKDAPAASVTPREQQDLKEELKNSNREAAAASASAAFSMKVHKRKRNEEVFYSYAVHEKATKRQVVQLTSTAKENADEIVSAVIQKLNAGQCTKQEAVEEINAFKPV